MTGDEIIGTAILATDDDGYGDLFCIGKRMDQPGRFTYIHLPIRPRAKPEKVYSWHYETEGDVLHVQPSVRQTIGEDKEIFHNPADWRVNFKRITVRPFDPDAVVKLAYDELKASNPGVDW